jgi:NhaP-type Na+/H+ or K+/H+ antiporter
MVLQVDVVLLSQQQQQQQQQQTHSNIDALIGSRGIITLAAAATMPGTKPL